MSIFSVKCDCNRSYYIEYGRVIDYSLISGKKLQTHLHIAKESYPMIPSIRQEMTSSVKACLCALHKYLKYCLRKDYRITEDIICFEIVVWTGKVQISNDFRCVLIFAHYNNESKGPYRHQLSMRIIMFGVIDHV